MSITSALRDLLAGLTSARPVKLLVLLDNGARLILPLTDMPRTEAPARPEGVSRGNGSRRWSSRLWKP